MNKILIVICLICTILSSCTEKVAVNYAVVTGTLSNYEGQDVKFASSFYVPIGDQSEAIRKQLELDEQGAFSDTVYLEKGRDFTLGIDRSYVRISLKPGENLHLTADASQLVSSIKYSGSAAPVNNYLLKYKELSTRHNEKYAAILKLNESDFKKAKDAYKNSIYQLLESIDGLTDKFIASQKRDLNYNFISSYLNYDKRHGKAVGDENFKTSANFLDIVSTVNYEDAKELEKSLHYGLLLKKYYQHEYMKIGDLYEDDRVKFIQFLDDQITDKKVKEELLFLFGNPTLTTTPQVQLCYDILVNNISNENYKKVLLDKYNQLKVTQVGQPSPSFTNYQNAAGGTSSLNDFRGKYVYIDVWATWCGPCKAEIPYLQKVEKKYHNKNIVFISLSVDSQTSFEKWKKFVKEKELGGVQLIADKDRNSEFIAKYQIEGIPRFILIDPNGKIVSADAPRPSDEKLIDLFNEQGI